MATEVLPAAPRVVTDSAGITRAVITDLPPCLPVLTGEAELVHQHLHECLRALFDEERFGSAVEKMK